MTIRKIYSCEGKIGARPDAFVSNPAILRLPTYAFTSEACQQMAVTSAAHIPTKYIIAELRGDFSLLGEPQYLSDANTSKID